MPKNVPSLKPRELLRILVGGGCSFLRHGKGDHDIYQNTQATELVIELKEVLPMLLTNRPEGNELPRSRAARYLEYRIQ